jgi:hypothetical protein
MPFCKGQIHNGAATARREQSLQKQPSSPQQTTEPSTRDRGYTPWPENENKL